MSLNDWCTEKERNKLIVDEFIVFWKNKFPDSFSTNYKLKRIYEDRWLRIRSLPMSAKGYISSTLFEQLFIDGIHLITKIRKNMKNSLTQIKDKIILRKRALIETVDDELKNMCQVEHTRHRSFENFLTNLLSGLIVYSFFPKKPSLNIEIIDNKALIKAA